MKKQWDITKTPKSTQRMFIIFAISLLTVVGSLITFIWFQHIIVIKIFMTSLLSTILSRWVIRKDIFDEDGEIYEEYLIDDEDEK